MDFSSHKTMGDSSRTAATATSTSVSDDILDDLSDWNMDLDAVLANKPQYVSSPVPSSTRAPLRRSKSYDPTRQWAKLSDTATPSGLRPSLTTSKSVRIPRKKLPKRSVSFDKVKIREFQQVLGDAPGTDDGPSLGLGWNYHEKKETNVDKFEAKRTSMFTMGARRKTNGPRSMSPKERIEKACKLGFSLQEIQKNRLQNLKVQEQRMKTADRVNEPLSVDPAVSAFLKAMKA